MRCRSERCPLKRHVHWLQTQRPSHTARATACFPPHTQGGLTHLDLMRSSPASSNSLAHSSVAAAASGTAAAAPSPSKPSGYVDSTTDWWPAACCAACSSAMHRASQSCTHTHGMPLQVGVSAPAHMCLHLQAAAVVGVSSWTSCHRLDRVTGPPVQSACVHQSAGHTLHPATAAVPCCAQHTVQLRCRSGSAPHEPAGAHVCQDVAQEIRPSSACLGWDTSHTSSVTLFSLPGRHPHPPVAETLLSWCPPPS